MELLSSCYVPFILLFHSVLLSVSIVPSRSIIPFRSIVPFYCSIPCSVYLRIHSDTSIISLSSLRELRTSSVIRLRYHFYYFRSDYFLVTPITSYCSEYSCFYSTYPYRYLTTTLLSLRTTCYKSYIPMIGQRDPSA